MIVLGSVSGCRMIQTLKHHFISYALRHWGLKKCRHSLNGISNAFSWRQMLQFKFHLSGVEVMVRQVMPWHLTMNHYQNQQWLRLLLIISRVSCQKGPICHAQAWRVGPLWQDTIDMQFHMHPWIVLSIFRDEVILWKHFTQHWTYVRRIQQSPVIGMF